MNERYGKDGSGTGAEYVLEELGHACLGNNWCNSSGFGGGEGWEWSQRGHRHHGHEDWDL